MDKLKAAKKIENLSFCLFESVNVQFDNRSDT